MLPFLRSILQQNQVQGVDIADLCLDHELVADQHPEKFQHIIGLDLFPNLEILSIVNQGVEQANGIAHLQNLRRLDLSQNAFQELGEIPQLTGLQWLDISHNELENLDGVQSLHQLTELQTGFNLLQDLNPLQSLPELKTLVLNGNRYLKTLHGLPQRLESLHLGKCILHDYAGLLAVPHLRELTLSPGSMQGLDLLSELPALTHLHLQATRAHGNLCIPPMRSLRSLKITKAQMVAQLQFPAGFEALASLEIQHSALTAPPDLQHCPGIKSLAIKHSPLQNLNGLAQLPCLESLNLEGSAIPSSDLAALRMARPDLQIEF